MPASHPITIATGMNANNAGETSSPSTLFDTIPVTMPGPRPGEHGNEDGADRVEVHRKLERADDGAEREVERDRARNQRERERGERTSGRKGHRRITYYSQRASHHTHRHACLPHFSAARRSPAWSQFFSVVITARASLPMQRVGSAHRATPRAFAPTSSISRAMRSRAAAPGTPGNDSAAAYLAREYARLGLTKIERATTCPEMRAGVRECVVGRASYLQYFSARSVAAAHAGLPGELPTQNVIAMQPGTDPALRGEYVVIGAHYDHLGRSSFDAMDPDAKDAIRHGADDNASGTAAVLELARRFHARPARRSIIFVNFSGEELGDLGSEYFVEHSPVPLDSIDAMLNFDMVGRLRNDKLIVYGVTTATEMQGIVDSANTRAAARASTARRRRLRPVRPRVVLRARRFRCCSSSRTCTRTITGDGRREQDQRPRRGARDRLRGARRARSIADRPARLTYVRSSQPPPRMSDGRRERHVLRFRARHEHRPTCRA